MKTQEQQNGQDRFRQKIVNAQTTDNKGGIDVNAFRDQRLIVQLGTLGLFGGSIILMGVMRLASMSTFYTALQRMNGVLFWFSGLMLFLVSYNINRSRRRSRRFRKSHPNLKQFGLLQFFSNPLAKIVDLMAGFNLIAFLVVLICFDQLQILSLVLLGTLVLCLGLHCIFNGVNYIYLNQLKGERK